MKSRTLISRVRLSCSILIFAATFLVVDPETEAACLGIKGTFLQLTDTQLARPTVEWRQLFDELRRIGIDTLFLQWTVVDRKPLFQTAGHEAAANTPLAYFRPCRAVRDSRLVRVGPGFELLGRYQAIFGAA